MIVSDRLGIPMDKIRYEQSDTALIPRGGGTGGSRSLQLGGSAVGKAADAVLEQARAVAAQLLEAAPEDIVVTDDGRLGVAGVPASAIEWSQVAAASKADGGDPLLAALDFEQDGATFPFGAHIAVVEVDTETGRVELVRHIAVDDCGRILNPLIVAGQQHGGIAQGVAQALYEQVVYDEDGNPLTANLMDYAIPSAAEMPSFEAVQHRDADAPQPARREGDRRVGQHRLDPRGAERRGRRARPPRHPPRRHAVHARAGVVGDPRRRRREARRIRGGTRRRSSPSSRARPSAPRTTPTTTTSSSTSSPPARSCVTADSEMRSPVTQERGLGVGAEWRG